MALLNLSSRNVALTRASCVAVRQMAFSNFKKPFQSFKSQGSRSQAFTPGQEPVVLHQGDGPRSNRRVAYKVRPYEGKVYVDLRHYEADPEIAEPEDRDYTALKKGICISVDQFKLLVDTLPKISEEVEAQKKQADADWKAKNSTQNYSKGGYNARSKSSSYGGKSFSKGNFKPQSSSSSSSSSGSGAAKKKKWAPW